MKTLTLNQVIASGLTAETLNVDRIQFRYNTFSGDEHPLRYFLQGEWHPVHASVLETIREYPNAWLSAPTLSGFRSIEIPRDGWRHEAGCGCELCRS